MTTALILGASGNIGSRLVRELDKDPGGLTMRLASHLPQDAERWRAEGRDGITFDLNDPTTFAQALEGVESVFVLTTYTAEMLFQGKTFVDAAVDANVKHLVHSGVFSSRRDLVPHYTWHDLLETYIQASGIAWTNLHPNNIIETTLLTDPAVTETGSFSINFGQAPQGWVAARDIAAVAAAVLREGPTKHNGADYWLSTELLTGHQVAEVLTHTLGRDITCVDQGSESLAEAARQVPQAGAGLYLASAAQKMRLAASGNLSFEAQVRDDVQTVLGRPGLTVAQWAKENLSSKP
jgi:uncharacterized protein YbjT (DUF2867 family)